MFLNGELLSLVIRRPGFCSCMGHAVVGFCVFEGLKWVSGSVVWFAVGLLIVAKGFSIIFNIGVCKDRSRWRSVVSAYRLCIPLEKDVSLCTYVCLICQTVFRC